MRTLKAGIGMQIVVTLTVFAAGSLVVMVSLSLSNWSDYHDGFQREGRALSVPRSKGVVLGQSDECLLIRYLFPMLIFGNMVYLSRVDDVRKRNILK